MERLTARWCPKGYDTFDPVDIVDNEYSKTNYEKIIEKLGEYEDAEEQGLLLRLPCKVGDVVYYIQGGYYKKPQYCKVKPIEVTEISLKNNRSGKNLDWAIIANGTRYKISSIGKTVFLTKEEAEAALEKMKGEEHE